MDGRQDILDVPMYVPADVARMLELQPQRVRRWLRETHDRPVVKRAGSAETGFASFLDLMDLFFVKQFLEEGISLQRLRRALDEARDVLGMDHFAHQDFWASGRSIFLKVNDRTDALRELLTGGQWVIARIIEKNAKHIDFDEPTGVAMRWHPLGRSEPVVVDPRIQYGAATIAGRRVTTAVVLDSYKAERKNVHAVSKMYGLSEEQVRAALRFEERFTKAA